MLTISPCVDKQEVAAYCKKCRRVYSEAFYLYLAENRGEVLAAGLFEVTSDSVQAVHYESAEEDASLFDGILRAGLNYASEQGLENGKLTEEFRYQHREMFSKLNYPIQPVFNITNFFQKYKSCKPGLN